MNILVVEDDQVTASALRVGLAREGHEVVLSGTVASAKKALEVESFDAAILDVSLPDGTGYEVLSSIRERGPKTSVLMLTARGAVRDRVEGLDRGADDYLVKPFAFSELTARLRALDRRPRFEATDFSVGALKIDLARRVANVGEGSLDLTPIEFGLLAMLSRDRGQVISRGTLLREVWGYDFEPTTNIVDVHVNRLRRKLEEMGVTNLIKTIRRAGYSID